MKKIYKNTQGFTLIELIVSITIFGMMMISVVSIFIFASQMSTRVELNRIMQENIKNVVEDIAENVRKDVLENVLENGGIDACIHSGPTAIGTKLCLDNGIAYSIGYRDGTGWSRSSDIVGDCGSLDSICHILKRDSPGEDYYPLSNSFVHFENISFIITNTDIPKVTIQIKARPAYKKGLSTELIKNNYTYIQTTVSERLIETH